MKRRVAAALVLLALAPLAALAQARGPRTVTAAATLSILEGRADRVTPAGQRARATDGMTLAAGDRVITGGNATALITFLDGSTVTVQPGSDVVVRRLDGGGQRTSVFINAGAVWARVARLATPGPRFSLESNTATAAVHDGIIGARHDRGSFSCWTQRGELVVTDAAQRTVITLAPGQMTTVEQGTAAPAQAFAVMASTLRVDVSPNVWALVDVPYQPLVAGFVAPGVEVNQVYGSVTRLNADGTRTIEVPAGYTGPYAIILESDATGPYMVTLTGLFRGHPSYRLDLGGSIAKGQRLATSVMQDLLDPTGLGSGVDFRSARATAASAATFRPMREPLPGVILLSPGEIAAPR